MPRPTTRPVRLLVLAGMASLVLTLGVGCSSDDKDAGGQAETEGAEAGTGASGSSASGTAGGSTATDPDAPVSSPDTSGTTGPNGTGGTGGSGGQGSSGGGTEPNPTGGSTGSPEGTGGSGGSGGSGTPGTPGTGTTGASPVPGGSPEATIAAVSVTPDDLGAGWNARTLPPTDGLLAALLPCVPAAPAGHVVARANGPMYSASSPGGVVTAASITLVFDTDAAAQEAASALGSAPGGACATEPALRVAGLQGSSGPALAPVSGLPSRGAQSAWLRAERKFLDPTEQVEVTVDALLGTIRTGRTLSVLLLVSTGGKVDQWMINDLSQALADRQRA